MKKVRCNTCNGSGKVMGGGMIFSNCNDCEGLGYGYNNISQEIEKNMVEDKVEENFKDKQLEKPRKGRPKKNES